MNCGIEVLILPVGDVGRAVRARPSWTART
jgi:hypothetical protein